MKLIARRKKSSYAIEIRNPDGPPKQLPFTIHCSHLRMLMPEIYEEVFSDMKPGEEKTIYFTMKEARA